uniref:Uncharacterized protein n=1 Tax=Rhizophora mucronata TaxID=61149 RepID=A0A2P2MY83_RHIMU
MYSLKYRKHSSDEKTALKLIGKSYQ